MTINKKSKILVFRIDRIGDLVNTSSFLNSLKSYYENSEIILVCSNYNRPIAESYKFIDKIVVYDKSFIFFKKVKILMAKIALNWSRYLPEQSTNSLFVLKSKKFFLVKVSMFLDRR
mgnify:CR=1 FL=1